MNKYFTAFMVCIMASINIFAQEKYDLYKCRKLAVKNSNKHNVADYTLQKTEYEKKALRSNFFPRVNASGMYIYMQEDMTAQIKGGYLPTFIPDPISGELVPNILMTDASGNPIFKEYAFMPDIDINLELNNSYSIAANIEQAIYMGGKVRAAYKMSKIANTMAKTNKNFIEAEILLNCDEAFWNCIKAELMIEASSKYKEVIEELRRIVSNAVEAGMKHRNDYLKVMVKLNEAELNVQKAIHAKNLATMNLCNVMGIDIDTPIELEYKDIVSGISYEIGLNDDMLNDYVEQRPEHLILGNEIELKKQNEKLIRSDFLPNLSAVASYSYMDGFKFNNSDMLNKATLNALVSLKIPVFHWGEGRNKLRSAKMETKIAEEQFDDTKDKIKMEIRMSKNNLIEAKLEAEMLQSSFKQAEENLRLSRKQYEIGRETLADYLEAQAIWQKSWADMINGFANFRLSESKYKKSIGELKLSE